MVKQRRDSIAQFQAGGRDDLARNEQFELVLLEGYLPAPLTEAELAKFVDDAISETGAHGPKDMGKVMALLKERIAGRADLSKLAGQIKARLAA